jgi:hypothetical protein
MSDNDSDDDIAEQRSQMWAGELDEESDSETDSANGPMDTNDTVGSLDAKRAEEKEKVAESAGSESQDAVDNKSAVGSLDAKDAKDTTEWDVDSIRDSWNPNSVRLPDSIQEPFGSEYKRLDYLLEQAETEFKFGKDRYYKPLVVALGVQAIQEKDSDEIVELVERMEQGDLPGE